MKILMNKKKLAIIIVVIISVTSLLFFFLSQNANAEKDTARRREFTVARGDITVGTDADGTIASGKQSQFLDIEVKIEDYVVQKGSLVKKGDVIARIDEQDLEKRIKDAKLDLKSEEIALAKANADKKNFVAESDKKVNDLRLSGETAYNEKHSGKAAQKTALENTIAEKRAAITKLENDIVGYNNELAKLPVPQGANSDVASEGAPPLPNVDYPALKASAEKEIEKLKQELAQAEQSLAGINSELNTIKESRGKEVDSENKNISLMNDQNSANMQGQDRTILQAQATYKKAKEKLDALTELAKNPQITAQFDGVILNLGYTPHAITAPITAVVDIGLSSKKGLNIYVDPDAIVDIEVGQEVSFYVDAYPDVTFMGVVKSKLYLPNDAGKYGVNVEFSEQEHSLPDGMGASATIIAKQKKDVLTLQNKAISNKDGKSCVFIAKEDGSLETREIKTGFSDGRITQILDGLVEGDIVIVEEKL